MVTKITSNYIEAGSSCAPFVRYDAAMNIVCIELDPARKDFIRQLSPGTEVVLANPGGERFAARVVAADPVRLSVTAELR